MGMIKGPNGTMIDEIDLVSIDESKLCSGTDEDEFLDLWELGMPSSTFSDPEERKAYEAFVAAKGGFDAG